MAQEEINVSETVGERLKGWGTKIVSSKLWTPFAGVAEKVITGTSGACMVITDNQIEMFSKKGETGESSFLFNLDDEDGTLAFRTNWKGISGDSLFWIPTKGWVVNELPLATYKTIEWSTSDEADARLSDANVFGENNVGITNSMFKGQLVGEYLTGYLSIEIIQFGTVTLPTDDGIDFKYSIIDRLKGQSDITGLVNMGDHQQGMLDMGDLPMANIRVRPYADGKLRYSVKDLGHVADGELRANSDITSFWVYANLIMKVSRG